jgi:hypothetical protein
MQPIEIGKRHEVASANYWLKGRSACNWKAHGDYMELYCLYCTM